MALPGSNIAARQKLIFIAQELLDGKIHITDKYFDNMKAEDFSVVNSLIRYRFKDLGWGDYGKDFIPPMECKFKADHYDLGAFTPIDTHKDPEPITRVPKITKHSFEFFNVYSKQEYEDVMNYNAMSIINDNLAHSLLHL